MFWSKATAVRRFSFLLSFTASLIHTIPAQSYTITQTQNGQGIRWHYGQKFFLAGNTSNKAELSSTSIWNAVVNGLQQWKRASQGMFDFDYWQGSDPATFTAKQQQDGLNSIFFASASNQKMDPNIIGFTQVWYNSVSGSMIEADIILNDIDYNLTDQPHDTSARGGSKNVYLNNVITHELGHAMGLSHSNSINSTMLYVEFSEQNKLGCDDWLAAKHLYPTIHNGVGSLNGTILSPYSEPVAGAVVTAISIARGIPLASVLTDQNGRYNFGALEAGKVSLMVESYQGTPSSIPSRMRVKLGVSVCDNNQFPKNFITTDDQHTLQTFNVSEAKTSSAGVYRLNCGEVTEAKLAADTPAPEVMVDRGEAGSTKTYTFEANGDFKITGLGYLLLSPIKVSLTAMDASGNAIAQTKDGALYRSKTSDYKIEDSTISGTAYGLITVKAEISSNDDANFPVPAVKKSESPYFVLVFNGNPNAALPSNLPNNARCFSDDPLPEYQSPPGKPIRDSTTTFSRDSVGFCGNAHAASFYEGKPTPRSSTSIGSILGWAFPFLVAFACQLFLRKRRAKL